MPTFLPIQHPYSLMSYLFKCWSKCLWNVVIASTNIAQHCIWYIFCCWFGQFCSLSTTPLFFIQSTNWLVIPPRFSTKTCLYITIRISAPIPMVNNYPYAFNQTSSQFLPPSQFRFYAWNCWLFFLYSFNCLKVTSQSNGEIEIYNLKSVVHI